MQQNEGGGGGGGHSEVVTLKILHQDMPENTEFQPCQHLSGHHSIYEVISASCLCKPVLEADQLVPQLLDVQLNVPVIVN